MKNLWLAFICLIISGALLSTNIWILSHGTKTDLYVAGVLVIPTTVVVIFATKTFHHIFNKQGGK